MNVRTSVTGYERARRVLLKYALPEAEPAYRGALSRAADHTIDVAQREYMAGQIIGRRTGELADSLEVDPSGLPRWIAFGSDLEQAPPLHWGWPGHNLEPRPFLQTPVEVEAPRFADFFVEALEGGGTGGRA